MVRPSRFLLQPFAFSVGFSVVGFRFQGLELLGGSDSSSRGFLWASEGPEQYSHFMILILACLRTVYHCRVS